MSDSFNPKPNSILNKLEAGVFSDLEKLYMSQNYYMSFSMVTNMTRQVKKNEEELLEEKNKSWLKRDGDKVERIKKVIFDEEKELADNADFFKKQEAFLSRHQTEVLEGKNEEEILKILISNNHLIFKVRGTYQGLSDRMVCTGTENKDFRSRSNWLDSNLISPNIGKDYDCTEIENIFNDKDIYSKLSSALPVFFSNEAGKGFGIISPRIDYDRSGALGYSFSWIIVPRYEKNIQSYLEKHPEMILKVFQNRFSSNICGHDSGLGRVEDLDEEANRLTLLNKQFINIDDYNKINKNY